MKRKPASPRRTKARPSDEIVNAAKPKLQRVGTHQAGAKRNKHDRGIRLNDFLDLPEKLRSEAQQLFVEGATFEDIVEYINERHISEEKGESEDTPHGVTPAAVKRHFRGNLSLQTQRIKRLQERGQALKSALTGDPSSAEAELADAIFFTGMMGMDRAGAQFRIKEAKQVFLSRQNMRLKEDSFELKRLNSEVVRKNVEARTVTELKKQEQLNQKLSDLEKTIAQESGAHQLGPETLRKIREIYGLFSEEPILEGPSVEAGSEQGSEAQFQRTQKSGSTRQ
jgi:hypothetical protein